MTEPVPGGRYWMDGTGLEQALLRVWVAIKGAAYCLQHPRMPEVPDDIASELQAAMANAKTIIPAIQASFDYIDADGGQQVWCILSDPPRGAHDDCLGAQVVARVPYGEGAAVMERLALLAGQTTTPDPHPAEPPHPGATR